MRYGEEWEKIYDINFVYKKNESRFISKTCQNIITYDIETSNGVCLKDGNVIGFDHDIYNLEYDKDSNIISGDLEYHDSIQNGTPVSCLYIWQCAIEDMVTDEIHVFMGRTWEEMEQFMNILTQEIRRQAIYGKTSINRQAENSYANKAKFNVKMFCFIHNLSFEFIHLRNIYNDAFAGKGKKTRSGNVFARTKNKPMKVDITLNKVKIEFRDTLVLTGKSLKQWCEDEALPVQKLSEPKDYYLQLRTPETLLTDEEIEYSKNDVVSMVYGMKKYRDKYGTLENIPLTHTGEIRRQCRTKIAKANKEWAKTCYNVTTSYSTEEFKRLVHLFQGGWTHANKDMVNITLKDVKCYDLASSYPACMLHFYFPVDRFIECNVDEFGDLEAQDLRKPRFRWYMKVKLTNVRSKLHNTYWSLSKLAYNEDNPIGKHTVDNGRIFKAEYIIVYMTDLDWDTFQQCYSFSSYEVIELYKAIADHLPIEFIKTILYYFRYKTSLKGLDTAEGMSAEVTQSLYGESKAWLNSIYGVMVYKIISNIITFDKNGWNSKDPDDADFEDLIHQTKEEDSFGQYSIGIWITAAARHNLFDIIIKTDARLAYCDTDSVKGLFNDDDIKVIEDYNKNIETIQNDVADTVGLPRDAFIAKTADGKEKRIGIFEREPDCLEFRTLGCKRYVDKILKKNKKTGEMEEKIECTIAGLPKSAGVAKIKSVDDFKTGLVWNTKESGKLVAHYQENQPECIWTDRNGVKYKSTAKYGLCLLPTTFDLSFGNEFEHFLDLLWGGAINRDDDFYTDTPKWFFN